LAFKLATAFVSITGRDKLLRGTLSGALGALRSFAAVGARFATIGLGVAATGTGFAVKIAADAEEMQSKFEAVFKELTGEATQFAEEFAGRIGRSVGETKRQMSEFQDVLVPLGFARKDAAGLSKALLTAATDLASFNNKTDAQASEALLKALTGEREMLKSLGIVLSEADLKHELLARGQNKLTGQALKQAKAVATLDLILRGSSDAQGDAERTAGGFTNRLKALLGTLKDTAAVIGSAFLPALATMAKKATDSLQGVLPLIRDWAADFAKWGTVIVDNWSTTWDLIKNTVMISFEFIKSIFEQYPKVWAFVQGRLVRLVADTLITIGSMFVKFVNEIPTLLAGVVAGVPIESLVGQLFEGALAGISKKNFADIFEPSPELTKALNRQKDLINQLSKARTALDASSAKPTKIQVTSSGVQKIEKAVITSFELPKGFFGFEDIGKKIQDALFKTEDPQKQMQGLLEADKVTQQRQLSALEQIAGNTIGNDSSVRPAVA
jgi:hypothetical protein